MTCEPLWRRWWHLAIMQGRTSDSKCSLCAWSPLRGSSCSYWQNSRSTTGPACVDQLYKARAADLHFRTAPPHLKIDATLTLVPSAVIPLSLTALILGVELPPFRTATFSPFGMAADPDASFRTQLLENVQRDLQALRDRDWLSEKSLQAISDLLRDSDRPSPQPRRATHSGAPSPAARRAAAAKNNASGGHEAHADKANGARASPAIPKRPPAPGASSAGTRAKALHDNESVEEGDLPFKVGDIITHFSKGKIFFLSEWWLCFWRGFSSLYKMLIKPPFMKRKNALILAIYGDNLTVLTQLTSNGVIYMPSVYCRDIMFTLVVVYAPLAISSGPYRNFQTFGNFSGQQFYRHLNKAKGNTVIADIFVCDLILFISYFWLKVEIS